MAPPSNAALPLEPTLDEIRAVLAPLVADAACFDGWSEAAIASAAAQAEVDPAVAQLAFPGGPMDVIAAWVETVDAAMMQALPWAAGLPRPSTKARSTFSMRNGRRCR